MMISSTTVVIGTLMDVPQFFFLYIDAYSDCYTEWPELSFDCLMQIAYTSRIFFITKTRLFKYTENFTTKK